MGCKTIAKRLLKVGHTKEVVSRDTVARSLKRGNPERLVFQPQDKRQRLTVTHKAKRVAWANQHQTQDFTKWMWVDSKIFRQHKASNRRRWQRRGKLRPMEVENHPNQAHMYAALTPHGVSELVAVSGTTGLRNQRGKGVSAAEYSHIIERLLVPAGNRLFIGQPFIVYEDGAPPHSSKLAAATWAKYPHIKVVRSPPCSPDLNPIENLWNIIDDKMMGMQFQSFPKFLTELQRQWATIDTSLCLKLCKSVKARVTKLLDRAGSHIERNIYS